ncbi:hypothetical protein FB45DRAFT_863134 [Roridomyces roridus]|uniref:Uncharacterized protein n=1 Tax=Roridomyces roridus TaxID=1738132 RepID=A0AAD7FX90_9AGAR|nr:hypothetical protein FB45DRAFT_863134 [Roridomyces roridus]
MAESFTGWRERWSPVEIQGVFRDLQGVKQLAAGNWGESGWFQRIEESQHPCWLARTVEAELQRALLRLSFAHSARPDLVTVAEPPTRCSRSSLPLRESGNKYHHTFLRWGAPPASATISRAPWRIPMLDKLNNILIDFGVTRARRTQGELVGPFGLGFSLASIDFGPLRTDWLCTLGFALETAVSWYPTLNSKTLSPITCQWAGNSETTRDVICVGDASPSGILLARYTVNDGTAPALIIVDSDCV